jgi:hypothetical protein
MEQPRLGFWQIWNMSFGFLGIQFGWGLQLANMSAIYEYLHARPDQISMLWLAAPLTGLIIQPIIGHMSDRTWSRLGRRRPYFLAGAILSSLALILMPNSSALWMAAGLLWILDASSTSAWSHSGPSWRTCCPTNSGLGVRDAKHFRRPGRGGWLGDAVRPHARVSRVAGTLRRNRSCVDQDFVLPGRCRILRGGDVDHRHDARISAGGSRRIPFTQHA